MQELGVLSSWCRSPTTTPQTVEQPAAPPVVETGDEILAGGVLSGDRMTDTETQNSMAIVSFLILFLAVLFIIRWK